MNAKSRKRPVPVYPDNDIRSALCYISRDLKKDNVLGIKFLLLDILPKPVLMKRILGVFEALQNKEFVDQTNPWLIIECLMTIHRNDLVEECFKDLFQEQAKKQLPTGLISRYRLKLFEISMELVNDERKELVYLFGKLIPKLKRESKTTLDVFTFLEETRVIGPHKTEALQSVLNRIDRAGLADALKELRSGEPFASQATVTRNVSTQKGTSAPSSSGIRSSQSTTLSEAQVKALRGAEIKNKFDSLRGKTCQVIYKKSQQLVGLRYIFEVKGGEALSDLLQFKIYLNADPGTWSGISNPILDSEDGKWEVCLWCRKKDFSPQIPPPGTECTIRLKDVNIYCPPEPGPRHTIVNIECEEIKNVG